MDDEWIHFCPRCGAPVTRLEKFGRIRPVCPKCAWIYFSDPKVAAAILIEEHGRVLLVRRSNEPFRGLWSLPAGFVDAGEDPAQAAARECLEETGLIVEVSKVLAVVPGREHVRGADFVIVYSGEISGGILKAGDDADRAEWFPAQDLPPLAFEATRKVLSDRT